MGKPRWRMNIKRQIAIKLDKRDGNIKKFLIIINNILFHHQSKYRRKNYGNKYPDKTFYIIRPTNETEGLLSLFFTVMRNVEYSETKGFIPVVDFSRYETQYSAEVGKGNNVWDYFFQPVSQYSLDEVYESKNVYLSGWGRRNVETSIFKNDYTYEINEKRHIFIKSHTGLSETVKKQVDECYNILFKNIVVLGVYVRGTDYVRIKPKGHPIQPELNEVKTKVDSFLGLYAIDKIFLVTEDYSIYQDMVDTYGEMIMTSDDYYIKNYKDGYIYKEMKEIDASDKGLKYLIKMILLARCDYLVTTLTNGSLFSLAIKDGDYLDSYIFNLGKY